MESVEERISSPVAPNDPPAGDDLSAGFVGEWNRLVSHTNWEKGRIIAEWRAALIEKEAHPSEYADERWCERVGGVSAPHVGRLRRVWDRFRDEYQQYNGLYWSHFLAALEWDDAPMWLEGAVQDGWSVSVMRARRWEAIGAPEDLKPRDEDIVVAEIDEERFDARTAVENSTEGNSTEPAPWDGGDDDEGAPGETVETIATESMAPVDSTAVAVQPFADVPELPDDLTDGIEQLKLAILNHKMQGWKETSPEAVVAGLEGLKLLVTAPTGDEPTEENW